MIKDPVFPISDLWSPSGMSSNLAGSVLEAAVEETRTFLAKVLLTSLTTELFPSGGGFVKPRFTGSGDTEGGEEVKKTLSKGSSPHGPYFVETFAKYSASRWDVSVADLLPTW